MKYSDFRNEVHYTQSDDSFPWFYMPYWTSNVRNNGCGMISLAMCIELLKGIKMDPCDVYRIRQAAGLDQLHVANKEATSVCGGDVTLRLNPVNRELFGIESRPMERTVDAFREVLEREGSVIWASSRECNFYNSNGEALYKPQGHVICFWRYEDGIYYAKDCHWGKDLGNNVPYTEEQLQQWLDGFPTQQFELVVVEDNKGGKENE